MSFPANGQQALGQGPHKNLDDEFSQWIQDLLDEHHILGASVAVVDNGIVETAGYGLAQLPDVPSTADTIYRLASTSKAIGAAVMGLILKDESKNTIIVDGVKEKLTWSTPISKILGEDFELNDEYATKNLTIEDALSNRSGVSGHDFNFGPWMGEDTAVHTRSLKHIDIVTKPMRTTFQYTNTLFAVIGHVIEKLDGKSFDEAARERIWKPLGMNNTFATLSHLSGSEGNDGRTLARGYYWATDDDIVHDQSPSEKSNEPSKGHYVAEAHLNLDLTGPAAAVLSTANDYARWIAALLEAGNSTSERNHTDLPVITPNFFTELTTARTLVIPSFIPQKGNNLLKYPRINPQLYALGWFTDPWMYTGQTILHHPGGCQGFGSHVFLLPEHKFGLVVMENGGGKDSKIAYLIGRELIRRRLGLEKKERDGQEVSGIANGQDQKEDDTPDETKMYTSTTGDTIGTELDESTVPGVYEHKAYGRFEVSLAQTASLQTPHPNMNGARITRTSPPPIKTNPDNPVYRVHPLGTRSFLASILLHPLHTSHARSLPNYPPSPPRSPPTFYTLENLWPHGPLQSDPNLHLPSGHGSPDNLRYPFKQEGIYESQGFMGYGACIEGGSLGLVLGRTESSEVRAWMERRLGKGGDRGPIEGWRGKMVWFEKVDGREE